MFRFKYWVKIFGFGGKGYYYESEERVGNGDEKDIQKKHQTTTKNDGVLKKSRKMRKRERIFTHPVKGGFPLFLIPLLRATRSVGEEDVSIAKALNDVKANNKQLEEQK